MDGPGLYEGPDRAGAWPFQPAAKSDRGLPGVTIERTDCGIFVGIRIHSDATGKMREVAMAREILALLAERNAIRAERDLLLECIVERDLEARAAAARREG